MYPVNQGERPYEPDSNPVTYEEAMTEIRRLRDGLCTIAHCYEDSDEHDTILRWCFHEHGELDLR